MHTPPLWCAIVAVLLSRATFAQTTPEALRARIEALHDAPRTPIAGRRLANADAVAHFLEARGFTPPWNADAIAEIGNPDWTVPPTILANDVLEGMRKGENTIARKRLAILDGQGHPVSPGSIDWQTVTPRMFPYTLRQPPGPDNALGRVKFIFPNEHAIFLHDTPSRELFTADRRTFSCGCIRVERPLELAAMLLRDQDDWTPEKIARVVEAGKSETVFLKEPLPVVIVYWTVSVGASGDVRFARDVYGRDAAVLRALDAAPVPSSR